ncbi:MAG: branched-chain amino acid transport system II carrier protein [Chlamydiia bacterium]
MKKWFSHFDAKSLGLGLAIFSMFFGAGNIIFPLALGLHSGDKAPSAVLGLVVTAVIMPVAGVIAMLMYGGDYRQFFGRLGRIPGLILATATICLLGPFGGTPRCIALSFSTLKTVFTGLDLTLFCAAACCLLFIACVRRSRILDILGWGLTPVLLGLLLWVITLGFMTPSTASISPDAHLTVFLNGLSEGYNTMDLLAAFFFSSMVITLHRANAQQTDSTSQFRVVLHGSLIGSVLLACVYVGFSLLASLHGHGLSVHGTEELLAAISSKIAGPYAGAMVCVIVAVACFTTALALLTAFSDFIHKEILGQRGRYEWVLAAGVLMTFVVSTLEFRGIAAFLGPVLQVCYPGLIVLTMLNILHRWKGLQSVKTPVVATFAASTVLRMIS